MSQLKKYYYDKELCQFVELVEDKRDRYKMWLHIGSVAIILGVLLTIGLDKFVKTPEEMALISENAVLQNHLLDVGDRMAEVEGKLGHLSDVDQNLYRTLLQTEPISDDVLQVGVGGSDPYAQYDGYSESTATLLRSTAASLDRLERQINLQNTSYRELSSLAREHNVQMAEMPALVPSDGPVVSGFGRRLHPILNIYRPHNGIDILVSTGTKVVAPGDGVVVQAGRGGGLGNYVRIKHPTVGYVTTFAHLSSIPTNIKRGVTVSRGDVIGLSGNTGLSKAPHLHYEVRDLKGKPVNPIYFFAPNLSPQAYKTLLEDSQKDQSSLD
ncbi:MAG: M23 family metallopeptidase [Rhodothermales bacterium]|nr:M23 family metallopeptidase [Rhodothermales bacterium]